MYLHNADHTVLEYTDHSIVFPSKHEVYSNKEFNSELQELIIIARLMGMQIKVSYGRTILSYYFIDDDSVEIKLIIKINKRNRVVRYSYWDTNNNKNYRQFSINPSLLKEIKRKL